MPTDSPLAAAESISQLDALFPGVTRILETRFESYKGKGTLECQGFGGEAEAETLLAAAIESFASAERDAARSGRSGKERVLR